MSFRCVTLLLTLVAIAVGTGCPDPARYPICKKDEHCNLERGEKCVDGQCQNCVSDADCVGKGELLDCREFRCQELDRLDDGGEVSCASTDDCAGGWVCIEGTCTQCTDDSQCAPSTCNMETGRCSNTGQCQSDDQCPMDEICENVQLEASQEANEKARAEDRRVQFVW